LSILISLSTFVPSKMEQKLINIGSAIALVFISNRLDKLHEIASGYEGISQAQSTESYHQWLTHAMKPPLREVTIAQPIEAPAPVQTTDIKKALSKPHILILGETNSGKSTLVKFLISHASAPSIVLDSHAAPDDWQNMTVIGMGRNYRAIGQEVDRLVSLMNLRYELRSKGQKNFETLIIVLDEFPACVANLDKSFTEQIMILVREARKVSIKLIVLSQGSEVKSLGIEGQGSIRECFAMVAIGKFAIEKAKSLKDEGIKTAIAASQYPAMLDDFPCELPQINSFNLQTLPLPNDYLALSFADKPIQQTALSVQSSTVPLAPISQKIIDYLDGRDWTRDNMIKQSVTEFKLSDTPIREIQACLQFLELEGHLETRNAGRNGLEAKKI